MLQTMMVSDFVQRIADVVNLNITGIVITIIVSIVFGTVTHKVATSIQSHVVYTVCALLLYLFWYYGMNDSIPVTQVAMTVSLVVAGREGYKRLRGRY
jgi:predicted Na+-dependent transporter